MIYLISNVLACAKAFSLNSLRSFSSFKSFKEFAAIIGDPVGHSYTPAMHQEFFNIKSMPVFKISGLKPKDLKLLNRMGLKAAAVTSPYKKIFMDQANYKSNLVKEILSLNTLFFSKDKGASIYSDNTDIIGLTKTLDLISDLENKTIVVFGGGGTLNVLKKLLPETASYYSAREEAPRGGSKKIKDCDILIWASGSNEAILPLSWSPEYIIDLSYVENSFARQIAINCKAKYISGETMFIAQAEAQQAFWSRCFKQFS